MYIVDQNSFTDDYIVFHMIVPSSPIYTFWYYMYHSSRSKQDCPIEQKKESIYIIVILSITHHGYIYIYMQSTSVFFDEEAATMRIPH